jgi:uncharacterized membrane protein
MSEQTTDFSSSEFRTEYTQSQAGNSSSAKRNALLIAGASAIAFGLWRRDRFAWPALIGGSALLAGGATQRLPRERSCEVSQTINRSPAEISSYLRDGKNWPQFMKAMKRETVERFDVDQSGMIRWSEGGRHWTARFTDSAESLLRWRSESDAQQQECSIELRPAPGNRGTEVHWRVRSTTPQTAVADLFRMGAGASAEQMARESLRALKQLLETGELATTDGQPHGVRGAKGKVSRAMFRESVDEETPKRRPGRIAPQRVAS